MNVYAIDDQGRVHDVAYELDAKTAKAMAATVPGGIAADSRPKAEKPKKDD